VGYLTSLKAVRPVAPRMLDNRVVYSRAGLQEWYVNGPLGLEQGFTLARAPSGHQGRALALSMALSGNAHASLAPGGQSLTITRTGGPALRYGSLRATDATGRVLRSWLQLHSRRLLVVVDTSRAHYPLRIDPLVQQAELKGGEETGNARLGFSVALSSDGNTALVGGMTDNSFKGAAWVFTRSGSTWTQQAPKLTGSEEIGASEFGGSVALSSDGNTALIGGEADNASVGNAGVGAAWVFTRSGSAWTQQGPKLTGGAEEIGAGRFGDAVALSSDGNTALIGAGRDNSNIGAVWAFTRSGSTWTRQAPKLTGSGEIGGAVFGSAIALSAEGNTALIGGGGDNGPSGIGAAWVFTRSGSAWTQQGPKLTGSEEIGEPNFGFGVALSSDGNTALIGGPNDGTIFEIEGEVTEKSTIVKGLSSNSGISIGNAVTGTKIPANTRVLKVIGEHELELNAAVEGTGTATIKEKLTFTAAEVGAAWVFTRSGSTWTQQAPKLTGGGELGSGRFGLAVALSSDGNTALIGGPRDNNVVGAAWVFMRSGPSWTQQGSKLTASGEVGPEGRFGYSVALSSLANTALIGSPDDHAGIGAAWVFVSSEPTPGVTKIEPTTGPAAGGTSVTITGTGFIGATAVRFGSNNAASFTVNSATSITAVSPAGAGTVDVTVTTPAGTSPTGSADQFTYGPTVTKVEPNRGSTGGGTTVTLTGTGFTGASAVNFGATSAKSFTVNSNTSITAVSPKVKGNGTVDVTVTTPIGTSPTSAADHFTFSRK
jgi:hypothetical protein